VYKVFEKHGKVEVEVGKVWTVWERQEVELDLVVPSHLIPKENGTAIFEYSTCP
jgi:hypothetical protein